MQKITHIFYNSVTEYMNTHGFGGGFKARPRRNHRRWVGTRTKNKVPLHKPTMAGNEHGTPKKPVFCGGARRSLFGFYAYLGGIGCFFSGASKMVRFGSLSNPPSKKTGLLESLRGSACNDNLSGSCFSLADPEKGWGRERQPSCHFDMPFLWGEKGVIMLMDKILDHLKTPWGDASPLSTNKQWFAMVQSGAGFRPPTV